MIAYYKYTDGESFTLNGVDYTGFFNITDAKAYTGKTKTSFSDVLSPKYNFISDFYMNKMEFDNQYQSITNITPYFTNTLDILNKNELDKMFSVIDSNNLIVFKSLITNNPQIIDFDEESCYFYGLSSSERDERNDDVMYGKDRVSTIDPFDYSSKWAFLENVLYGDFIVKSDQNFKYLCSTGRDLITINGSFINGDIELEYNTQNLDFGEEVYGIHYDDFENKINIIINDEIKIYEAINYIECEYLLLVDSIKINDVETVTLKWSTMRKFSDTPQPYNNRFFNINTNNVKYMKYGSDIRTSIDKNLLTLYNKKSKGLVEVIDMVSLGIDNLISINIREVDDLIGILHEKNGEINVCFFDPLEIVNSVTHSVLKGLEMGDYDIVFSTYDSNIFYIRGVNRIENRFISNPKHSIGNFKEFNLKYPQKYSFSNTFQKFGDSIIKWNTNNMSSNRFHNILFNEITKNGNNYTILHNSGRLYVMKQSISKYKHYSVPIDIEKNFQELSCGQHSFGLFFNRHLTTILKDILNLYTKSTNSYKFKNNDVVINQLKKIEYDMDNLRVNGNESINITTMQRIFTLIIELQKQLIANLSTD